MDTFKVTWYDYSISITFTCLSQLMRLYWITYAYTCADFHSVSEVFLKRYWPSIHPQLYTVCTCLCIWTPFQVVCTPIPRILSHLQVAWNKQLFTCLDVTAELYELQPFKRWCGPLWLTKLPLALGSQHYWRPNISVKVYKAEGQI